MTSTHFWQKVTAPVRNLLAAPSRRELKQGLEEVSAQNSALRTELEQVRQLNARTSKQHEEKISKLYRHVERTIDEHAGKITELDLRVDQAGEQVDQRLEELQQKIDQASDESLRKLSDLEQNIEQAKRKNDDAQQKLAGLTGYLREVESRQDKEQKHTRDLLLKVKLERNRQIALLQEVQDREQTHQLRAGRLVWVAGIALLISAASGTALLWGVRNNDRILAKFSRDISDIKLSMSDYPAAEYDRPRTEAFDTPDYAITRRPASAWESDPEPGMYKIPTDLLPRPSAVNAWMSSHQGGKFAGRDDAQKFFEENASQLGVISLHSGLQYRVISQGYGRSPGLHDKVRVDYRAYLLDGTEFDSSYRNPDEPVFTLDEVIPGWKEALLRMEEGAQWELYIPADLAHRGSARKRGMLGHEPLVYIMELKSVIEPDASGNDPRP